MKLARPLAALAGALASLAAAWSLPACGSDAVDNRDYGEPPDAAIFNPGLGGSDGYGSSGSNPQSVPFVCPDELKRCGSTFTYPFANETSVELRGDFGGPDTWVTGKPMTHAGASWTVDVDVPYGQPVQYKFFVNGTTWMVDPAQPSSTDANGNTNNTRPATTCDPALCEEDGALPPGVYDWRDSVIYFVFVDRFFNGDTGNDCHVAGVSGPASDYQGGDWKGVTQKINDGYFNDLGVNTLWLTVPTENPKVTGIGQSGDTHQYSGYHGYWPKLDSTDPTVLAPEDCFGTKADLQALVTAAHAKGLKVLFDYAMVHVHDSSGVYAAHNDWFWPNSKDGSPDCVCGGAYCSWDSDYQRCWFTSYLPHWNYTNADARNYSVTQAIEWIKEIGVDGFRADAIKHVDISWLTQLRAQITSQITSAETPPQRFYMVGETYDFSNRAFIGSFIDPATKLDGQFDFPLRAQLVSNVIMRQGTMTDLSNFMNSNDYFYGANAVMSTFVGNHDLPRIIHLAANSRIFGDDQSSDGKNLAWSGQPSDVQELAAYERLANGFAVLATNRGAPLVYYGDEIGMAGAGDPDNRRFMQWTTLNSNQQYLHDRLKALLDIRSKHPALRRGIRTTLEVSNDLWAYSRVTTGDTVYVAINRSDTDLSVNTLPAGSYTELVTNGTATGPSASIPARQTRIFVAK